MSQAKYIIHCYCPGKMDFIAKWLNVRLQTKVSRLNCGPGRLKYLSSQQNDTRPQAYKTFFMPHSAEIKFRMLVNVKISRNSAFFWLG